MDENKSINPENNTQNKEKVKKEKKKYDGFFKSLWNSIFKIEKYSFFYVICGFIPIY